MSCPQLLLKVLKSMIFYWLYLAFQFSILEYYNVFWLTDEQFRPKLEENIGKAYYLRYALYINETKLGIYKPHHIHQTSISNPETDGQSHGTVPNKNKCDQASSRSRCYLVTPHQASLDTQHVNCSEHNTGLDSASAHPSQLEGTTRAKYCIMPQCMKTPWK